MDADVSTMVRVHTNLKNNKLNKVVIFNDDTTSMEFVILVLMQVFEKDPQEAVSIMMTAHLHEKAIVGTYPRKLAMARRDEALRLAREWSYPDFKITVEE